MKETFFEEQYNFKKLELGLRRLAHALFTFLGVNQENMKTKMFFMKKIEVMCI